MGLIRFLLAAAVVLGHAPGWGGFPSTSTASTGFITPYHAVQAFFILSGFYMAMTWPRYEGLTWKFYLNRYSRLIPSFWVVASVTLMLWVAFPTNPFAEPYVQNMKAAHGLWAFIIAIPNIFLIGADSYDYFPRSLPQYWIVPQTWSIGTEIWFYLLVPLLVPARLRILLIIIAAGILLRLFLVQSAIPFYPWQQKLFWTELSFFLIGILAHRQYVWLKARGWFDSKYGTYLQWISLGFGVVFICAGNHLKLFPFPYLDALTNSAAVAIAFCIMVPWWHSVSKTWRWDRFVGDFAYPIYLWHIVIGYYSIWAQTLWYGYFLLLASMLASIPLVILIERPLERWRQSSLSQARKDSEKTRRVFDNTFRVE